MHSLDCDEMTLLWPNDCMTMSFYQILSIRISNVTTVFKKFFDCMCSLDCDKMTVLWLNDCIIIVYYHKLSIRISNVTTFVREVFWLDV